MIYVFLFSFAALQICRHKIVLSIENIGGAMTHSIDVLRVCFGVNTPSAVTLRRRRRRRGRNRSGSKRVVGEGGK